ncbi:MAG: MoaD/ThiS family protein [Planctomycetota bacterium]
MSAACVRCAVKLFGKQADLAGGRSIDVEVTPCVTTCREVLDRLAVAVPALQPSMAASVLAVDHEVAAPTRVLRGDEELALIGLVGGG